MPRKVFVAGEILTAADVNTNLMDQAVMVFDDATDRATAIPTPVEGMVTYLEDVGGAQGLEVFDGSVFTPVAIVPEPAGLVAVKSAIRTTPEVVSSVEGGGNRAVGGLSITHAMTDAANKLVISAFFGTAANSAGRGEVGIAIHDGTSLISIGTGFAGTETAVTAGGNVSGTAANLVAAMPSVTFVHAPGDTTSRTYTVRAINVRGDTQDLFINRRQNETGDGFSPRGVSSLVIQEVTV